MKKLMKIIGVEVIRSSNPGGSGNGLVKVILLPKDIVKAKKPGLMDLASGGLADVIEQAEQAKQYKSEIYISMGEWLKHFRNEPMSDVYLDLTVSKYASEIARG